MESRTDLKKDTSLFRCFDQEAEFKFLLSKIHRNKGIDFNLYRPGTLKRRISSRLTASRCAGYGDYVLYLNSHPSEYDHLINVLTVNLTEFFRDPETFEAVRKTVVPEIIKKKEQKGQRIIRVWSAGTSAGEEAYSLTMMFKEALEDKKGRFNLHVYGTDIDSECLVKSKASIYELSRMSKIPENLAAKYFDLNNKLFQVKPELRQMTRFKRHNLISDAPLLHMDLILCRNVLIYFSRPLQEIVYQNLTNALNDGGFLVLGKAESLWGPVAKKYETVNAAERIYKKVSVSGESLKGGNDHGTEYFQSKLGTVHHRP